MLIPAVKRNANGVNGTNATGLTIGSNVVTGVAIRFGAMGSDNSVIVIPISDVNNVNNQMLSGVNLYTLIDGSVIIRIEISVPTSLCPSSNDQPIDACLTISYQAYTVVNNNQITSALLVDVHMACGDVCSLPSGLRSASCTTCDRQQVSGYDTPVTRRHDMGSPDQITVWNGRMLLFDTGRVDTFDTIHLNYSNSSPCIRVNVEPNCACTIPGECGTLWHFTVYCLNSTTSSSQNLTNNSQTASVKTIKSSLSDKADIESRRYANRNKFKVY